MTLNQAPAADSGSGAALNPFDPAFYARMHARLRELRKQGPVLRVEGMGTLCTTSFADSVRVLRDPRLGKRGLRNMLTGIFGPDSHIGDFLFFSDPPEHERLRGIARSVFTAELISSLADAARQACATRVAELRAAGGGDLVSEFAWKIPVPVIGSLFGLPPADSSMIENWGRELFLATDPTRPDQVPAGRQALLDMYAYFTGHIAAIRKQDDGGFLASLAAATHDGSRLTGHELVIMVMQLVIGGYDTTANQIANGAHLLLSSPRELAALQADWSLLDRAVEEILRCEPATPFIGREVLEGMSVGGVKIAAGEFIGPLIAAANRDPDRFADPDTFDIQAIRLPHLSFGRGLHFCLGDRLARLNLATALTVLFGSSTPVMMPEAQDPQWRASFLFRGIDRLTVHLT